LELLQPPPLRPRRQYAVEQILNAHSQIFLQHPFNVDFNCAAPFYIWGSLKLFNNKIQKFSFYINHVSLCYGKPACKTFYNTYYLSVSTYLN
jgi:hypothetical protein